MSIYILRSTSGALKPAKDIQKGWCRKPTRNFQMHRTSCSTCEQAHIHLAHGTRFTGERSFHEKWTCEVHAHIHEWERGLHSEAWERRHFRSRIRSTNSLLACDTDMEYAFHRLTTLKDPISLPDGTQGFD